MKTFDEMHSGLVELAETDLPEIKAGLSSYFDMCMQMHKSGREYENASTELGDACNDEAGDAEKLSAGINKFRFAMREQALLMNAAAKMLANLSTRKMATFDKLSAIIGSDLEESK